MIGILLFFLCNPFIPRASLSIYVEKEHWFRDSEFKRKGSICRMDSITDQNVKTGLGIGKDFIAYYIFWIPHHSKFGKGICNRSGGDNNYDKSMMLQTITIIFSIKVVSLWEALGWRSSGQVLIIVRRNNKKPETVYYITVVESPIWILQISITSAAESRARFHIEVHGELPWKQMQIDIQFKRVPRAMYM